MQDIAELRRQGLSIGAIGKLTGFDWKTIRGYLQDPAATPVYGPQAPRPSKLDPHKPYIEERLRAGTPIPWFPGEGWAMERAPS